MNKVMKILNVATRVMLFIVLLFSTFLSLATAYIMFAPDEFPKPFYLVYAYSGNANIALPTGYYLPESAGEREELAAETEKEEEAEGEDVESGIIINMATKIVNLADPSGRKYIRVTVALEFAPDNEYQALEGEEKAAHLNEFETAITNRMAVMDDVVITLLSTKTYEQLYTAEGKEALRTEMLDAIHQRVPDLHVLNVYFTEFVVQ